MGWSLACLFGFGGNVMGVGRGYDGLLRMSHVYALAPTTEGKIVLNTTLGSLDIELWAKQAPRTCRNFVQLCMEHYYDDTIFHRLIKGFMVQGGDPTGTGRGGESIYDGPFKDEFHSRLRFVHRGIVAMANSGPNTNQSQFFITLDKTPHLDKQYTILGKVTGDTIFNLLKVEELEIGEDDRPLYPPKIVSAEIVWNPFDDIIPRRLSKAGGDEGKIQAKKKKKCARKDLKLLSFGDEEEQESTAQNSSGVSVKMKGSYAFSDDPLVQSEAERQKAEIERKHRALEDEQRLKAAEQELAQPAKLKATDGDFAASMARRIEEREASRISEGAGNADRGHDSGGPAPIHANTASDGNASDLTGKKRKRTNWVEEQRARYKKQKLTTKDRRERAKEKLSLFKKSLMEERIETHQRGQSGDGSASQGDGEVKEGMNPEDEEEEDGTDDGWRSHALKFSKAVQARDPFAREDKDVYVTIDPLKETSRKALSKHELHLQRITKRSKKLEKW